MNTKNKYFTGLVLYKSASLSKNKVEFSKMKYIIKLLFISVFILTLFQNIPCFGNAKVKANKKCPTVHAVVRNTGIAVAGPCDGGGGAACQGGIYPIVFNCGMLGWQSNNGKKWGYAQASITFYGTSSSSPYIYECRKGFNISAGGNYFPPLPIIPPPDSLGFSGSSIQNDTIIYDDLNHNIRFKNFQGFVTSSMPNYTSAVYVIVYKGSLPENDSIYYDYQIISKSYFKIENDSVSTSGIFTPIDVSTSNVLFNDTIANESFMTKKSVIVPGTNKIVSIPLEIPMDSVQVAMFCESGYGPFLESKLILPAKALNLNVINQGFYNPTLNSMISDSARIYLRNMNSPYAVVESSKSILNSSGAGTFIFSNALNGVPYYIQVKHRNSIETWSVNPLSFVSSNLNYDFTSSASQAFGNNMIQVDASPLRFAIYSGDVDQDGVIDASDASIVDNDGSNFVSGYVNSDVTGDEIVDASDAAIVDNNGFNFVYSIHP